MANIVEHHKATIDGAVYQLTLSRDENGYCRRYVRVERKDKKTGEIVMAFLSNRQHKAEQRAYNHFAKQIKEFFNRA